MSETETVAKTNPKKFSICEIMKTNTSQIIQKLESQIPSQFQQYSDLYTSYLHTMDDFYGTCYISEKEFFDNLNIDQSILKSIQDYSKTATDTWLNQVDLYAKYREGFFTVQKSTLKVYDNLLHTMIESYAKNLSQFNNPLKSSDPESN